MPTSPRGLTVLLTGGRGFVGSSLTAGLLARDPALTVVAPPGPECATGERLDILDREGLEAWISRVQPNVVVHLAAIAAVTTSLSDPRLAWDVNLVGTLNLVLALQRCAPSAHLLHMSSAEVYGASAEEGVLTERALLQPQNPYAASKAAADILVRQTVAQGMSATIARPFNQIGPGQAEAFALPSFAAQIARIEAGLQPPMLSVGALDDERDFLPVSEATEAYLRIIERRREVGGEIFNICSGRTRRVGDVLDQLLSLSTARIEVRVDPTRLRSARTSRVAGDNARARERLDWSPRGELGPSLQALLDAKREEVRAAASAD